MALYRCAMCGSSKIVPETKQEGYNKKKGIWGAVLFGGIGALAGTSGNTVTYYHCGDCGAVLNRTMQPFEKESIERCLASPDVFESSLKSYKERYKNIEWEEKPVISTSDNLTVSDIEERIIEYMKGKSVPVRCSELDEKQLGIAYPVCSNELSGKEYDNYISRIASIEMNMRSAIQNLRKRGIIKYEKIENDSVYIFVTDIEEMKELALKESADEKAKELLHTNDYTSIIKEMLSAHDSMTWEEIYDYLKQNNHLTEDVIKAEKQNRFIPLYFTKACIRKMRVVDRINKGAVDLVVYENDRYRLKSEKEVKEGKAALEGKTKEEIKKQIDTLMPMIITLQTAKKSIKISELRGMCDDLKKYPNQTIVAKLNQLANIGIVEKRMEKKIAYFSIVNIPKQEIDNILYKAISNHQIHGFLD